MKLNIALCFVLALCSSALCEITPRVPWTNNLNLKDGFKLRWVNTDDHWLTMEMSAPIHGYVAIGFSPNGAMQGSDIIMGWVDKFGEGHIKDLYATGNQAPMQDVTADVELLGAEETAEGTTIRFRRKWNTCDKQHDYKITEDTIKLIWAYGHNDPDHMNFAPNYHVAKEVFKMRT